MLKNVKAHGPIDVAQRSPVSEFLESDRGIELFLRGIVVVLVIRARVRVSIAKMWHEARRSERKVHDLMDAARRRAQRRAVYLARRRGDPQQSLQVVGTRCRTHRDDGLYQAAQDQQGLYVPYVASFNFLFFFHVFDSFVISVHSFYCFVKSSGKFSCLC